MVTTTRRAPVYSRSFRLLVVLLWLTESPTTQDTMLHHSYKPLCGTRKTTKDCLAQLLSGPFTEGGGTGREADLDSASTLLTVFLLEKQ